MLIKNPGDSPKDEAMISRTPWLRLVMLVMIAALAGVVVPASAVRGQGGCPEGWQPFDPSTASYPGVNGSVYASTMWDPDGPTGPMAPRLVIGGSFTVAGSVFANNIAVYDFTTGQWSALGTGIRNLNGVVVPLPSVTALASLPNGDLIVGGHFDRAGGVSANNIARWNGTAWSALGTGITGDSFTTPYVNALATLPNGDLIVGGSFTRAGGVFPSNIARWNGLAWSTLGGASSSVSCLLVLPTGDLIVGGSFTSVGGLPANGGVAVNGIARWKDSKWFALGSGVSGGSQPYVSALTTLPGGELIAGGRFTTAGGVSANNIASWNGSDWSALGSGTGDGRTPGPTVATLTTLPNGELIVGGNFKAAGGVLVNNIARWNGAAWSALALGTNNLLFAAPTSGTVYALTIPPNGDLVVGGDFSTAGSVAAPSLARYSFGAPPPTIATQPSPALTCPTGTASMTAVASGTAPFTYQWQWQPSPNAAWVSIVDGLNTDPLGGPNRFNASGAITGSVTFSNLTAGSGSGGSFSASTQWSQRCIVTNACGSVTSNPATLTIQRADFNCSGAREVSDIFSFIPAWFAKIAGSDFNNSGATDITDITDFLAAWFAWRP